MNTSDYYRTRAGIGTTAGIANSSDFNRDEKVDAKDLAVVRSSLGNRLDLLSIANTGMPVTSGTAGWTSTSVARFDALATGPASAITNESMLTSPIETNRFRRRPL